MEPENPGLEMAKAFAEGLGKESANKLVTFIRGFAPFWGLKRKAVDVYIREIERSNLSPEGKMIAIANTKKTLLESENQTAIIDIACTAIGNTTDTDFDAFSNIDTELVSRLIDSGKFVSDGELQLLWGHVLAGEFDRPGSVPKNIVRILSELSKEHATIFSNICSLCADILIDSGNDVQRMGRETMIFGSSSYLQELNINVETIRELEHLGLINFASMGFYNLDIPNSLFPYIHIVCEEHAMTAINRTGNLPCGQILLTKAGQCISRFAPMRYNPQHMENIKVYLKKEVGIEFLSEPGIRITKAKGEGTSTEYSYERLPITPPQT